MCGASLSRAQMILRDDSYVPALRWRQAEYQALFGLESNVKDRVVPLITIPEIEYDFERQKPKSTVQDFVQPFVGRYLEKWGFRPAWIALADEIGRGRMDGGVHVFDYVFDGLRRYRTRAVPAVGIHVNASTLAAAERAIRHGADGAGVIVGLEDLPEPTVHASVVAVCDALGAPASAIDLVIDMGAPPNYEPYDEFAGALVHWMSGLGSLDSFRSLVLVGTAIPRSFKTIAKGNDEVPRHDWLFYRALLDGLPEGMRRPTYGDYTIVHPDFEARDPRKMNPVAKLVYAREDSWATRKGDPFRGNGRQMRGHCNCVLRDPHFEYRGGLYSDGDRYIMGCAAGIESTSTLGRWKCVGISHHVTTVVEGLAKLAAGTSSV